MKNNEKFGRWTERERLNRRDLIQPPHVYLSSIVGKALATAPSRPLMSPTNCKDVLQARSGFFFWPWYMPFPLCLSPWQGLMSNSLPKYASFKLLCFLANTDMLMNQRSFFMTSKPLWYNKHIACLNKMSFFLS